MATLIRFTTENFKSFGENKSISLLPKSIKDNPVTNIKEKNGVEYLCSAALYGANSSGKSNFIDALGVMKYIVTNSVRINDGEDLMYIPFIFNYENRKKATMFEVDFIIEGNRYRYGFKYNEKKIYEEWLYKILKKEKPLFIRNEDGVGIDEKKFSEGDGLEEKINDNRLFISLCGQLGGKISNQIIRFFTENLNVISGLDTNNLSGFTKLMLEKNLAGKQSMLDFFQRVQLGFTDLKTSVREFDPSQLPSDIPKKIRDVMIKDLTGKKEIEVFSSHGIYNEDGDKIDKEYFEFDKIESDGTKKLFDLGGPIFDTLENGEILLIDELDAKMHPLLSRAMVSLFNDPITNPKGAQLIFTTHDANLLAGILLRRDQIWFTEKDEKEVSDLYNMMQLVLPDGTKPRSDNNKEINYMKGRYGGVPNILPIIDKFKYESWSEPIIIEEDKNIENYGEKA